MNQFLQAIEEALSPLDVALRNLFDNLPPMTNAEIVFWNVGPLAIVAIILCVRDWLKGWKGARDAR